MTATISAQDLQARLGSATRPPVMIDVRTAPEYTDVHIAGTVPVPLDVLNPETLRQYQDGELVLVCLSGKRAERAAQKLAGAGFANLLVLQNGTQGWMDAGLPVVRGESGVLPLMRQVQLVVGLVSLTGALLALTISPWFALIPALTGAGLTFAGATGFCGLAQLLARMPWNRKSGCGSGSSCCAGH